jgi:DNA-binding XRE family transcriptional regulator
MGAIRNEIRRLRFEHGEMTQQELAERIGVTRQTVNAIEQRKYSPSGRHALTRQERWVCGGLIAYRR